jgi:hypothetical protein
MYPAARAARTHEMGNAFQKVESRLTAPAFLSTIGETMQRESQ